MHIVKGEWPLVLANDKLTTIKQKRRLNMSVLAPSSQQEGSGLLDNVDVTFAEVRVVLWDYNGKVSVPVPALKVSMELDDGIAQEQYYSLGKATDWQPNEDGTQIVWAPITRHDTTVQLYIHTGGGGMEV